MSSDPMQTARPAVMDIEASGFGRDSYPIEVGYVRPDGTVFCTLIRPQPEWTHWDGGAERLHGIDRDTLLRHGRDPAEVARLLNEGLQGMTVYSDGWGHDYSWLHRLFEAAGERPQFRLDHVHRLLNESQGARWDGARSAAEHELGLTRHRASADARLVQRTVERLQAAP
jgi:hypothetical protein